MKRRVLIGGVALPFVVLVILVATSAVNVPILDQWELVPLFQKYDHGSLGFADFFAQHNEHRLLFPRLLMFGLAQLSHWNVVWEMMASLLFAGLIFVFLYKILAKSLAKSTLRYLAAVTISCLVFSPIQFENWLWGWQVQWYMNIFGLVLAVWALSTWRADQHKRLAVAAAGGILATYSLGSGLLVWAVCLPLLWFYAPLRRWLWAWVLVAAATVGLHYVGYHDPPDSPARNLFLHKPLSFIKYEAVYVAHPLTWRLPLTLFIAPLYVVGLALTMAYAWARARQELLSSLLPWLCIGAYACLAAVLTGVMRLGLGVDQAYASRYVAISQLLLIMLVVVLYKLLEVMAGKTKKRQKAFRPRHILIAGLVGISILVAGNYAKGVLQLEQHGSYLQGARYCAVHAQSSADPCLIMLYPAPDRLWPRLQYLRSIHWGGL